MNSVLYLAMSDIQFNEYVISHVHRAYDYLGPFEFSGFIIIMA